MSSAGSAIAMNSTTQNLRFWIPGVCVPKARPKVTSRGTYFPERYQTWRQTAEWEILATLSPSDRAALPIHRAEVSIHLVGRHRGDADNLAGSCLDALVSTGVLLDDRLSCVSRLVISHEPKGVRGVWVEVKTLL